MGETPKESKPKPQGWSKASKRRAAARRRGRLPGDWRGDGHTDPPQPSAPCETCGLTGRCDCR